MSKWTILSASKTSRCEVYDGQLLRTEWKSQIVIYNSKSVSVVGERRRLQSSSICVLRYFSGRVNRQPGFPPSNLGEQESFPYDLLLIFVFKSEICPKIIENHKNSTNVVHGKSSPNHKVKSTRLCVSKTSIYRVDDGTTELSKWKKWM